MKEFDIDAWVNDSYVRQAFKELELDYDAQKQTLRQLRRQRQGPALQDADHASPRKPARSGSQARRRSCRSPRRPARWRRQASTQAERQEGQRGLPLRPRARHQAVRRQGLLRGQAGDPKKPEIVPFLLKKDAEAHAAKIGGKLATYAEALGASPPPWATDGQHGASTRCRSPIPMRDRSEASRRERDAAPETAAAAAPISACSAAADRGAQPVGPSRRARRCPRSPLRDVGARAGCKASRATGLLLAPPASRSASLFLFWHLATTYRLRLLHPLHQHPDAGARCWTRWRRSTVDTSSSPTSASACGAS